ncbi:MAG: hypothetical protein PCFJNLEI_04010 [Verrucomicrobiae bacterium]|nr:hypothetical protein [Verrucomicrobiae bacterium]
MPWKQFVMTLSLLLLAWTGPASATLQLPKMFSDHMVLQRDTTLPVWGWAEPNATITVQIAGQNVSTTADEKGRWQVQLAPLRTSTTPLELVVRAGQTTHTFRDVLVGDVWLCAGQSNMEFGVAGADNAAQVLATATNSLIRLLRVQAPQAPTPVRDLPHGWTTSTAQYLKSFSAVGYFFGSRIHQETGIPIGLIGIGWGGTAIELWLRFESLVDYPELAKFRENLEKKTADFNKFSAELIEPMAAWVEQARQARAQNEPLPVPPAVPPHPGLTQGLAGIYNGRVAPLVPFGMKGVLWYQGEANGDEDDIYFHKMRALIGGWRQAWNHNALPFYFVQLANYQAATTNAAGGGPWTKLRMAQLKSLQIPKTGMAVAIDIGDASDIHPRNKVDVGHRLALWALKHDYGQPALVCSGPLYKGVAVEGARIRVSFDHVGSGLIVGKKDGYGPAREVTGGILTRFAVAGSDRRWVWADAVIDGATVLVSSPSVPAPVAVRYAFATNPAGCNLYNKEGLPAAPFRSDDW